MNAPQAPDSGHLLFAYGTLMLTTGIAAVDDAMKNAGTSLGRGWIQGRIFDLGDYPGAVPASGAAAVIAGAAGAESGAGGFSAIGDPEEEVPKVWGHLLHLKDPQALFSAIDPYEGFDPADLEGSEFVREETLVTLPGVGKRFMSQVYFYNFPVQGREPIPSGDYLAFWHAKGRPAQGRTSA
jgi:gamma-glutamylcyclotransferase (GGCT)/AIG2-like uncharacterized protein YtfP